MSRSAGRSAGSGAPEPEAWLVPLSFFPYATLPFAVGECGHHHGPGPTLAALCLSAPSSALISPLSPLPCPKCSSHSPSSVTLFFFFFCLICVSCHLFLSLLLSSFCFLSSMMLTLPASFSPKDFFFLFFSRMRKDQRRDYWGRIRCPPHPLGSRPPLSLSCELPKTPPGCPHVSVWGSPGPPLLAPHTRLPYGRCPDPPPFFSPHQHLLFLLRGSQVHEQILLHFPQC